MPNTVLDNLLKQKETLAMKKLVLPHEEKTPSNAPNNPFANYTLPEVHGVSEAIVSFKNANIEAQDSDSPMTPPTWSGDETAITAMRNTLDALVKKAADDLLDENGNLHPKTIELLELKDISEKKPDQVEEIKLNLIYKYCRQMINQTQKKLLADGKNVESTRNFDDFFVTHFLEYKEHRVVNKRRTKKFIEVFSNSFKDTLKKHLEEQSKKLCIANLCAPKLADYTPEKLIKIMNHDLNRAKKSFAELQRIDQSPEAKSEDPLAPKIEAIFPNRLQFWIDVAWYFRNEAENNNEISTREKSKNVALAQTILDWTNQRLEGRNKSFYNLPLDYQKKLDSIKHTCDTLDVRAHQFEETPADPARIGKINGYICNDINRFLIDNIQQQVRLRTLEEEDTLLKMELFKNNPDHIGKSPKIILAQLRRLAKDGSKSAFVLDSYIAAFDYEKLSKKDTFIKRVETDISTLKNTLNKMPSDVKNFKIPNFISPENKEKARISLEDTIKELEILLNTLKPLSDDEITLTKRYWSSHIFTIAKGISSAIDQSFITEKMSPLIAANEKMWELSEEFKTQNTQKIEPNKESNIQNTRKIKPALIFTGPLYLNKILQDLDTGAISVEQWQSKLKEFCFLSLHYANRFNSFKNATETLSKLNEGDRLRQGALEKEYTAIQKRIDSIKLSQAQNETAEVKDPDSNDNTAELERLENEKTALAAKIKAIKPAREEQMREALKVQRNFIEAISSTQEGKPRVKQTPPKTNMLEIMENKIAALHLTQEQVDTFNNLIRLLNTPEIKCETEFHEKYTDFPSLDEAAQLIKKLPLEIANNLPDYMTGHADHRITTMAKQYADSIPKTPEAKNDRPVTIHVATNDSALGRVRDGILQTATTAQEQILLLLAVQKNLEDPTQDIPDPALAETIGRIANSNQIRLEDILAIVNSEEFNQAADLLKNAYKPKKSFNPLSFLMDSTEVKNAYAEALLLIQTAIKNNIQSNQNSITAKLDELQQTITNLDHTIQLGLFEGDEQTTQAELKQALRKLYETLLDVNNDPTLTHEFRAEIGITYNTLGIRDRFRKAYGIRDAASTPRGSFSRTEPPSAPADSPPPSPSAHRSVSMFKPAETPAPTSAETPEITATETATVTKGSPPPSPSLGKKE